MLKHSKHNQQGLTLIQVMVILMVIGVATVSAMVMMKNRINTQKTDRVASQFQQVAEASLAFYNYGPNGPSDSPPTYGQWPTNINVLFPKYLPAIPLGSHNIKNPWGATFSMKAAAANAQFMSISTTVPKAMGSLIASKLPNSTYSAQGVVSMNVYIPQQTKFNDPSRIQSSQVVNLASVGGTWNVQKPHCAPGYKPQIVYGLSTVNNQARSSTQAQLLAGGAVSCSTSASSSSYSISMATQAVLDLPSTTISSNTSGGASNISAQQLTAKKTMQYISACPKSGTGGCNDLDDNHNVWVIRSQGLKQAGLVNADVNLQSARVTSFGTNETQQVSKGSNRVFAITRCVSPTLADGLKNPNYVANPCDSDIHGAGNGGYQY